MNEIAKELRHRGHRACRDLVPVLLVILLLLAPASVVTAQGGDTSDGPKMTAPTAFLVEATEDWGSLTTALPYAIGSYTGAPHGSKNMSQLSGLDFASSDRTLNIADGWLVSHGRKQDGIGKYVAIQIDGADLQVEYWHLSEVSQKLLDRAIGSFIPLGFPIGKQGGTTGIYCTGFVAPKIKCEPGDTPEVKLARCKAGWPYPIDSVGADSECLYKPHIHTELRNFASPGQRTTRSSWDFRKLDNWSFFVNTTNTERSVPIEYDGTAVSFGVPTQTKEVRVGQKVWYSVVGNPETSSNTKYAASSLASTNTEKDCTQVNCQDPADPSILAPTDKALLQVGPHASPLSKAGPVKIVVDKQFTTLKPADFKVLIGGKAAQTQAAARIAGAYNTYELFIAPPSQPADGQYDLEVQVKGKKATSARSILYGDRIGVSYVLTLDISGSMNDPLDGPQGPRKITEAKATAENFVRLLSSSPPQESAGLITFGGSGVDNRNSTPQPATQAHKDSLTGIIRGLTAGGGTPLYDAIIAAVGKFGSSPSPTKVALVLSDGMNTTGSSNLAAAILAAKNAGVQVCTVRFGKDADLSVLNRISRETGCAAAQSALEPGQLAQAFDTIRSAASGLQTVKTFKGVAQPGQAQEFQLYLDQLAEATFKVEWQNPTAVPSAQLRINLIAPNGTQYTPEQLNGAEYITGLTLSAFRIPNPLVGLWKLIVGGGGSWLASAAATPDAGIPFEASVTGDSILGLRSYAEDPVQAGNLLELGVSVASTEPIPGATALVTIQRPSGTKVVVPLLDDGLHADGYASDGYYGAAFNDTFEAGTYRLEFSVEGQLPDGTSFSRVARREVEIQGSAGSAVLEVPLAEGLNLFALNGLAPGTRDPRSALLTITDAYTMVLSYNYTDGGLGFYTDLPDSVNTLKEMDPYQGYWIRATRPVTLQVSGPTMQQNAYVPVHPGWNLVPFLTSASTPLTEALSSIEGLYTGVRGYKNGAMSYWPQLPASMNTLEVLEPSLAYWVAITNTHALLEYPAFFAGPPIEAATTAEVQQSLAAVNRPQSPMGVTPTEKWVDLYSFQVALNGHPAPIGSVVTVYAPDNRKIGEALVETPGWVGVLAVYGDSAFSSDVDGARPGDILRFEINDALATANDMNGNPVRWTADGDLVQFRLAGTAIGSNKVFLPLLICPTQ